MSSTRSRNRYQESIGWEAMQVESASMIGSSRSRDTIPFDSGFRAVTSSFSDNPKHVIKILEGLVIAFGAFQFWTNRNERRGVDSRAAALARKAANDQAWQVVNGAVRRTAP